MNVKTDHSVTPDQSPSVGPSRFDREVHFARTVASVPTAPRTLSSDPGVFWQGMANLVGLFMFAAVFFGTRWINDIFGGPSWTPFAAIGACAIVVAVHFASRARRNARIRALAAPSEHGVPDDRYRVQCVGWEVPRADFDRLGPVQDRAFEPRLFPGFFAVAPGKRTKKAWTFLMVVFMLAGIALLIVNRASGSMMGIFQFPVAAILAAGVVAVCLPTYIRVVPGRVDVLHYTVFTRRARRSVSHTVRTARVLADLNSKTVIIHAPPDAPWEPATMTFWFGWMPRGTEFAHAVLEAAISSAPTPPLPEDELVG